VDTAEDPKKIKEMAEAELIKEGVLTAKLEVK
jgi:hypothetical protein